MLLHLVQVEVVVCYCILFKLRLWYVTASCSSSGGGTLLENYAQFHYTSNVGVVKQIILL